MSNLELICQKHQTFSSRLRDLRTAKGWKREELAAFAKVSFATVAALEVGRNEPTLSTIDRLGRAFDLSITTLVTNLEIGAPTPPLEVSA